MPQLVSHGEYMPTGQTDRRMDARPLHYAFRYERGQRRILQTLRNINFDYRTSVDIIHDANAYFYRLAQKNVQLVIMLLSLISPNIYQFSKFFHRKTQ